MAVVIGHRNVLHRAGRILRYAQNDKRKAQVIFVILSSAKNPSLVPKAHTNGLTVKTMISGPPSST